MIRRSIVVLAFALGCDAEDEWFPESSYVMESIDGKEWEGGMRFRFHDQEMNVTAGCNAMYGEYRLAGGELVAQRYFGKTEQGCHPAVYHEQDLWMEQFLYDAPAYVVDGPRLILTDDVVTIVLLDDEVADPDRPLVGPTWEVDATVSGGFAFVWGEDLGESLTFGHDGVVAIATPCASGTARYAASDGMLTLEAVVIDAPVCPDVEPAALVDEHMRELLVGALTYEIDARDLVIERGDTGLRLSTG